MSISTRFHKNPMQELTHPECLTLAKHLGDTPMTVLAAARLQQGMCRAFVSKAGEDAPVAALVFDEYCPEEPIGFGTDADALWTLLKPQDGWSCVNVNAECAEPLGKRMAAEMGQTVRYYGDVCHALLKPVRAHSNAAVRLLTATDVALLSDAPKSVQGNGYKTATEMVTDGIVAAAIVEGKIVAIAHVYAETHLHADIGVSTLDEWRGNGFATAAASLVAERIQARGKVPAWSCGEDNAASLRVAQKLGFTEIDRRIYVIPDSAPPLP